MLGIKDRVVKAVVWDEERLVIKLDWWRRPVAGDAAFLARKRRTVAKARDFGLNTSTFRFSCVWDWEVM
jgi:hypothetical protein